MTNSEKSEKIPITYDCSICSETYDVSLKKPYILTPCSHILCSSCMSCLKKLGENICPTCKSSFEKIINNLPPKPEISKKDDALIELAKIKRLKGDFSEYYLDELNQKTLYFERLREQIRKKTQNQMAKLVSDEEKIVNQVNNLENKFDSILMNFSEFDKQLNESIINWQPDIDQAVDSETTRLIASKIKEENKNLEKVIAKLKTASFSEDFFTVNEITIDDDFLNRLINKNNNFKLKESNSQHPDTIKEEAEDSTDGEEEDRIRKSPVKSKTHSESTSKSESKENSESDENETSQEEIDSNCFQCKKKITSVYNIYNEKRYHPDCFSCSQCSHVIVESTFYNIDEKPLCRICYNANLVEAASVCNKCGQAILDTLVTYKASDYHDYCLTCTDCKKSLIGQSIYSDQEKMPYCIECFTIKEAKFCTACSKTIFPNQTSFLFNSKHYHKGCFICCRCTRQILSEETFFKNKDDNNQFVCGDCFNKK